jgi:hypothetical protein
MRFPASRAPALDASQAAARQRTHSGRLELVRLEDGLDLRDEAWELANEGRVRLGGLDARPAAVLTGSYSSATSTGAMPGRTSSSTSAFGRSCPDAG